MTAAPQYVARRATVEDLPQLILLWELEQLSAPELEKRFTEFQVVCDEQGQVLGTIGIQISGAEGLLHSESIAKAELSDSIRALLWKRLQIMIQNHALERLWTIINVPFWRDQDFKPATAEQIAAMPATFKNAEQPWQVKILRAAEAKASLERELALLKTVQQEEAARLRDQVRWIKRLALGITVVVFLLVVVWAVTLLKVGPKLFRH